MSEWFETLEGIDQRVCETLSRGVADRTHVARTPTFATLKDGMPEARTVVLRAFDPALRSVDVHTDLGTAKVNSLRQTPNAAFHIWDASERLQIRFQTHVSILTGPEVTAMWENVPDPAKEVYGTFPAPGTVIADALAYEKPADPDAFAVLRCQLISIDALHLGADYRRASFTRMRDWAGEWLAP